MTLTWSMTVSVSPALQPVRWVLGVIELLKVDV